MLHGYFFPFPFTKPKSHVTAQVTSRKGGQEKRVLTEMGRVTRNYPNREDYPIRPASRTPTLRSSPWAPEERGRTLWAQDEARARADMWKGQLATPGPERREAQRGAGRPGVGGRFSHALFCHFPVSRKVMMATVNSELGLTRGGERARGIGGTFHGRRSVPGGMCEQWPRGQTGGRGHVHSALRRAAGQGPWRVDGLGQRACVRGAVSGAPQK